MLIRALVPHSIATKSDHSPRSQAVEEIPGGGREAGCHKTELWYLRGAAFSVFLLFLINRTRSTLLHTWRTTSVHRMACCFNEIFSRRHSIPDLFKRTYGPLPESSGTGKLSRPAVAVVCREEEVHASTDTLNSTKMLATVWRTC